MRNYGDKQSQLELCYFAANGKENGKYGTLFATC